MRRLGEIKLDEYETVFKFFLNHKFIKYTKTSMSDRKIK